MRTLKLMKRAAFAVVSAIAMLAGGVAMAAEGDSIVLERYDYWTIGYNKAQHECYAIGQYQSDQWVRINTFANRGGYMTLVSPGVDRLAVGATFPVGIKFGSGAVIYSQGVVRIGVTGRKIIQVTYSEGFIERYMLEMDMLVYARTQQNPQGLEIASMHLVGTYRAVNSVVACLEAVAKPLSPPPVQTPQPQVQAPKDNDQWEIPIAMSKRGYAITGTVDGVPVQFVMDTGANVTTIPESVGRNLGAQQLGEVEIELADGSRIKEPVVLIKRLQVGDVYVENIKVTLTKDGNEPLLGTDFLSHFSGYEINHSRGLLTLHN